MKYHESVMHDVRENIGLEPEDTYRDKEIEAMPRTEVLRRWLEWQGILGFTSAIKKAISEIYKVELKEES